MINKLQVEIILSAMRNQMPNRDGFLDEIKKQTFENRKDVKLAPLKKEYLGLEENVFTQKTKFSDEEIEEFEIIKTVIHELIIKKENLKY